MPAKVLFSAVLIWSISLVEKTSTNTGLRVFSTIKDKIYETGRKVSETFKKNMKIVFDDNLGKWNYNAIPNVKK